MAKSFQYGRVSVKVTPDLDGFYEELKAKLTAIEKKAKLQVKIGQDHAKAALEIDAWRKKEEADDINLDVKVNKDAFAGSFAGDLEKELAAEAKAIEKRNKEMAREAVRFQKEMIRQQKEYVRQVTAAEREIQKQAEETRRRFIQSARTVGNFGQELVRGTRRALVFSVAVGAAASAVSNLSFLVGGAVVAIGQMGAGLTGGGIGVLSALATGFLAVKLATSNMGEAMQAVASGDAAALKEAMAKLTPEAQGFVKQIAGLKPALDDLKKTLQASLFKALGDEVGKTGAAILKIAKEELPFVTQAIGDMGREALKFARTGENLSLMRDIIDNIGDGFRNMKDVGKNLVSIILDLVKAGTDLFPSLGSSFEDMTGRWAARIRELRESGELTEIFRAGIEAIKSFGRSLENIGKGIANIWRIGTEGSGGFLAILERVTGAFRNWTESIGGQVAIRGFFQIIGDLASAFGRLMQALSPLVPVIGRFVDLLANSLIEVMDALGPIITEVATALLDNLGKALPELTPFVIELAKGIGKILTAAAPLIPVIVKLLTALTPLIDPLVRLAEVVLPILADILEVLAPLIEAAAFVLGLMLDGVTLLLKPIEWLVEGIRALVEATGLLEGTDKFVDNLTNALLDLTGIGDDLKQTGKDLVGFISDGVKDTGNQLLDSILHISSEALFKLLGQAPEYERGGMSLMDAVNNGFRAQSAAINATVETAINAIINLIGGKSNDFDVKGHLMGQAFTNGFTAEQQALANAVTTSLQRMLDILSGRKGEFDQQGRDISKRLGGGMQSEQSPQNAARGIVGSISGIFSGTSLFGAGAAIMASLRSGIVSGIQAVKNVLTSMTSLIPTWKGPMTLDRVLLTPAGEAIMQGLVRGIESQLPGLRSTLGRVTVDIENAFGNDPAVVGARSASSLMEAWNDGIKDGTPDAIRSVNDLVKGTSATIDSEWKSTVSSEGFGSLASELAAAMHGVTVVADGQAIGRVVDKNRIKKERR